jgi:hypothetical protein
MENNIPLSVRLCRTMDVLVRFESIPPKLSDISREATSNLIIRALWKNQQHSEASQTSAASVYIHGYVEESLRQDPMNYSPSAPKRVCFTRVSRV